MDSRSVLHIDHITKRFGGVTAINNLTLEIKEKEIFGLIGPNGAGKTTVFNVIFGLVNPYDGDIRLDGKSIKGLKPFEVNSAGIARTFQIVKPFESMTVLENVMVGVLVREKNIAKAKEISMQKLNIVGLMQRAEDLSGSLTLAARKKLEMARALGTNPKILMLDEVMGGLNLNEVDEMIDVVRNINKEGVTIILIEHIMKAVIALSERLAVLQNGEKIAEGDPQEVLRNKRVIHAYLGGGEAVVGN
jgi:branched-chain amino acid transport system ATP-binding protein